MREILFRGKRLDNDEWAYGDLRQDKDLQSAYISGHGYYAGESGTEREPFEHGVKPDTVGQYIGLDDKNGVKIFEGDIVEGLDYVPEDGGYGVVGFDDGAFEVNGNNCLGTFHENYLGKDFEVIGNIHDNPELAGGNGK